MTRHWVVHHVASFVVFALLVGCQSVEGPLVDPGNDAAFLVADLQRVGAEVDDLGSFRTDPVGGQGTRLCVSGQEVRVYVFTDADQRASLAQRIDRADPSKIGGGVIVEWAGEPKFWQRDRIVVLYLGSDPAVEAALTSVLGPPFASGSSRDPGAHAHAC